MLLHVVPRRHALPWTATHYPILLRTGTQACSSDILALCANVSLGGGRVLACLVNHEERLASAACKPEVFRVAKVLQLRRNRDAAVMQP